MGEFEKCKRNFRGDEDVCFSIGLDVSAPKADPTFFNRRKREITLRCRDLREIFDPVLDNIFSLILSQISAAKERLKQNIINVRPSYLS